ncbi:MAG: 50S ribosomal protein L6 [Proteobacteria bacterium]|jgi:large subunit ribosomal protein L6|nr:50S ribosomal protein L6 [Pseudomonadota bacterium]
MSRIGKLPIKIPQDIKVSLYDNQISFDNGKMKKNYNISSGIVVDFSDNQIKLSVSDKSNSDLSMKIGMDRSNIKNIVSGMSVGFKTVLEVNGVGYKTALDKSVLILTLGYSHDIFYVLPKEISVTLEKPNLVVVSGDDKVLVGQVASEIISFRAPEPYKGKGIKKFGKPILRKEGKKK